MAARSRSVRPIAALLLLAMAAAAIVQMLAFWPGIMIWDSIRQYGQALSGQYDDWHPPAMNWLWQQLLVFGTGPGPMLALQALLYWSGFALIAAAALRRGRTGLAIAIGACALLPIPFWLMGTIIKDSLMAGALLLATGLIAIRRPGDRWLAAIAILLLIAAATLRFNAVPACLPLLVTLLPARWKRTPARLLLASAIAAVPLLLAMPIANRLLHARSSGVELSLVIYDLGGITQFSGVDVLPPVPVADPVAVNAHCYSPISWDSYAWWTADPCPIGFEAIRPWFAAHGISSYRWWAGAALAHPIAYAEHRADHYDRNLRFRVRDADLPALSLHTDPNPWGFQVPASGLRDRIAAIAGWSLGTPLGWPICWLALGVGLLSLGRTGGEEDIAWPLAWSAVLYALSYLPLSVASEVRYHVWTMTAVALATMLTLDRAAALPRARLAAAALPVMVVTILAFAARLAG